VLDGAPAYGGEDNSGYQVEENPNQCKALSPYIEEVSIVATRRHIPNHPHALFVVK
jgi:hypothetical protein